MSIHPDLKHEIRCKLRSQKQLEMILWSQNRIIKVNQPKAAEEFQIKNKFYFYIYRDLEHTKRPLIVKKKENG